MGLFDTLGMDTVEADPNALPDSRWVGEVYKSEFVEKKNGEVSHVITYRVVDGERKGAQRTEWFTIGTGAQKDDSGKITGVDQVTMSDQAKPWYKKRWEDLGKPMTKESKPSDLVGIPVIFATKKNGSFININYVEVRNPNAAAPVDATAAPAEGENVIGSL